MTFTRDISTIQIQQGHSTISIYIFPLFFFAWSGFQEVEGEKNWVGHLYCAVIKYC
jgi:hypothetical protein